MCILTDPAPVNNVDASRRNTLLSDGSSNLTLAASEAPTLLSERHDYDEVNFVFKYIRTLNI